MIKKLCQNCQRETFHNDLKAGGERCTGCGWPFRRAKTELTRAGIYAFIGDRRNLSPEQLRQFGWNF